MDSEPKLASLLQSAVTPNHVAKILDALNAAGGYKAVPVGRDNNIGTIRMASDPGLALVERITNGIDGLLERAVEHSSGPPPSSPAAAAHLLGVPKGGVAEMTEKERRELGSNLVVSLHDSGAPRRPTIAVADRGIGQHPDDFAKTLLSLNESNKVGKPYTMGTYGQGGSVTLGFSRYALFLSRRDPQLLRPGQEDAIGWTIAFEEDTDPNLNVLPRYVWIVQPDGQPFRLSPGLFPDFDHGTRIIHIEYDIQGLQGPFTTQMWQFLHSALFRPTLPFILTGDRPNDTKRKDGSPDSRVVVGNAARLANVESARGSIELGAYDSATIELGSNYGSVTAEWWALVRPKGSTSKSDPAASYVDATSAVSLTLHGQRQDTERRSWIKDRARMPFLSKNMVVHINANGLSPIARRELFASTRERATESELRKLIYERVCDLIRSDETLKALNHAEKERLLERSTQATNDKVRKRLGRFIKTKLAGTTRPGGSNKSAGTGSGNGQGQFTNAAGNTPKPTGGTRPSGGSSQGGGRNVDDSSLPSVPSKLAFESKAIRIYQGRGAYIWVAINAKNGYLPENDDALSIEFEPDLGSEVTVSSRSRLLGGRARWSFIADASAPLGSYSLTAQLITANGVLTASVPLEVVEPPPNPADTQGGEEQDTGPDVRWVRKHEWSDGFDAKTVGRVDQDDESTIIWVNRDYDLLSKALSSSALSEEQINVRADRYQFPIACGLWLQHFEVTKMETPPEESYRRRELHRLAEAVLVAMDPDVELAGTLSE